MTTTKKSFKTCTGGGVPSHLKTKRVSDKGVIAYKLPDELKNTETFDRFQKRKLILDRKVIQIELYVDLYADL